MSKWGLKKWTNTRSLKNYVRWYDYLSMSVIFFILFMHLRCLSHL